VPSLNYQTHLFEERTLRSVTANTRHDGEEFLAEAARIGLRVSAVAYPMDQADAALRDLSHDRVNGAAVLVA
jgi:propanol-preferring alcohol dehydrogenase